ncbi:MAG: hypothetical protein IJX08_01145, partial [Clostridia bacterium]|nr:hypothetical protein [Clostridia bacterium]
MKNGLFPLTNFALGGKIHRKQNGFSEVFMDSLLSMLDSAAGFVSQFGSLLIGLLLALPFIVLLLCVAPPFMVKGYKKG